MKATIKKKGESKIYALIIINGRTIETDIDWSLGDFLDGFKRVEFSNESFDGCSKFRIKKTDSMPSAYASGDFLVDYKSWRIWLCREMMQKFGLADKDFIYIKVRR